MELMTSLLLFVLTLLPQTLARSKSKFSYDVGSNNSLSGNHKMFPNIFFNTLRQPIKVSDLQSVFTDASCQNCLKCMERSIKAHRVPNYIVEIKREDDIQSIETRRDKRKTDENKTTIKKSKSKKNKLITVFKYVGTADNVYAIKVKESSLNVDNNMTKLETKCEVYKVEQYFPCESPEANLLLGPKSLKEKKNIKTKNEKSKDKGQQAPKVSAGGGKKYKKIIDDVPTPEHYMSSVEENMY